MSCFFFINFLLYILYLGFDLVTRYVDIYTTLTTNNTFKLVKMSLVLAQLTTVVFLYRM